MSRLVKVMKRNFPETLGITKDTEKRIDKVKKIIKAKWLEVP